jgi:primosomal protein N' (replication factor Y)
VEEHALRDAVQASTTVLRTMEQRALLQRIHEPSTVLLRLTPCAAEQKITDLRGAKLQHAVLDYLLTQPPGEWLWVSWIYAETGCSLKELRALEGHGLVELAEREVWRDPLAERRFVLATPPALTSAQERVWASIRAGLEALDQSQPHSRPSLGRHPLAFLLHGVTGSGKTEIYIRAVAATLERNRQAVVLVPEISLTPQAVRRFTARFPDSVGVVHSRLSDGERYDTWRRIRAGQIRLVIGPRSALFAPLQEIGLIVLDEEHDASYKQDNLAPPFHSRDVAFAIAAEHNALVLLGSATPDLCTYHRARETDAIQLLQLPQRILAHRQHLREQQAQHPLQPLHYKPVESGPDQVLTIDLPPVQVIDMRHELRVGNRSIFSRLLQSELEHTLSRGEQAILFLNRRGASTFVMCRDCGTVIRCPNCQVPLTYHLKDQHLTCHHCSHQQAVPVACPICSSKRIRHFGVGTERVQQAAQDLLPSARVLRWDRDTTRHRGSHDALLSRFVKHEADILVGTQMIAKGLDLPLVTLVGVISADTALNLPDFRAAERTFQLLEQVAGRAGRGPSGGQVVIQTYAPEHYAIQCAARHDYAGFFAQESAFRREMDHPPYARLARLVRRDRNLARCREDAQTLAQRLQQAIQSHGLRTLVLIGPAPCFLSRLRGRWRWQIVIRAPCPQIPCQETGISRLFRLVPPPPGWHLDLDPLDML